MTSGTSTSIYMVERQTVSLTGNPPVIHPLHFLPWANYGGTERVVLNLCCAEGAENARVLLFRDGPFSREFHDRNIWCESLDKLTCTGDGVERLNALAASAQIMHIHCMEYMVPIHELAAKANLKVVV